jgi:SAM-dependent methyltransferase
MGTTERTFAAFAAKVRVRLERGFRRALRSFYGFEPWHDSPPADKPYAADIIAFLNARPAEKRGAAAEIGCGLGDILRGLKYAERHGFDSEERVLKGARLLARLFSPGSVRFSAFTFPGTRLEGRYDAIIMVNWIHHVPPATLKAGVRTYFSENLAPGGVIVLDTVGDEEYEFNHAIGDLAEGLDCSVVKVGDYARRRSVFAVTARG